MNEPSYTRRKGTSMIGVLNEVSGQRMIMPGEELLAYLQSGAALFEELRPVGFQEEQLTQKLVDLNWSMNRTCAIQHNLLYVKRRNSSDGTTPGDARTRSAVSRVNGFEDGSHTFEAGGRCIERTAVIYSKLSEELDRVQSRRQALGRAGFHPEDCRGLQWYRKKIATIRNIGRRKAAAKHLAAG